MFLRVLSKSKTWMALILSTAAMANSQYQMASFAQAATASLGLMAGEACSPGSCLFRIDHRLNAVIVCVVEPFAEPFRTPFEYEEAMTRRGRMVRVNRAAAYIGWRRLSQSCNLRGGSR